MRSRRLLGLISIAAAILVAIETPTLAQWTTCVATNLTLGQITGSQIWDPGRGGYYYYGSAPCSFDCTQGDFDACQICMYAQAYWMDPDTGNWVLSYNGGPVYSQQAGCSSTGNNYTIWISYPATLKLAQGAQYQIVMYIAPWNPSTGACGNVALSSYAFFTGL